MVEADPEGILPPEIERISEGLAASGSNVAVEPPRCLAVIECGPRTADNELIGVFGLHLVVKVAQVLLSPVAAVLRPTLFARVNPGVEAVKRVRVLTGKVLLDEKGGRIPFVNHRAHLVPVGMAAFRENKDNRSPVERQVCVAALRFRRQVVLVEHGEVGNRDVGRAIFLVGLVVHHGYIEVVFCSRLLHFRITAVDKRLTITIPINDKGRDSHRLCSLDLVINDIWVLRGITRTEMCLGCPNHASYKAITCGEDPVARYFKRVGACDAEFKQPWGANRKRRSEIAKRFSINK